jgi:hypothetical protein
MKFARYVFALAGLIGLAELIPLYFIFDLIGRNDPPPVTHPGFYYGFAAVGIAWQLAFLVIARDPIRLRPLMPVCALEKFGYGATIVVLFLQAHVQASDLGFAAIDLAFGLLFIAAWTRTPALRDTTLPPA